MEKSKGINDDNKKINKKIRLVMLMVFALVAFILSISLGAVDIPIKDVFKYLFLNDGSKVRQIIYNVRLHRTLTAGLVGVCLSLSGVILQGIMRNPLASPGIIGVTSGAGLGAVIILILYPNLFALVPIFSFIGAVLATLLIYALSWNKGISPYKMVLAGIAISSLLNAIMQSIFILYPSKVQNTVYFMVGGLSGTSWKSFYNILWYAVLGIVLSFIFYKKLNVLALGDDIARGLGTNVELVRMLLILISSVLAAAAVSTVGLLGFVGLIGPHITRLIIGSDHKYLIPGAVFLGAGLVMACDTIARIIFRPTELPVGIIMAIIGVPFFLYLLRINRRSYND